jgi:uncharacterized membrane protein
MLSKKHNLIKLNTKTMKKIFLLLFTCFLVFNSKAQIHVTNNASEPIWVAYAYYSSSDEFNGYVSTGWWKLIPGETKILGGFLKNGDNTYYISAHTANYSKKWGSEVQLAVNSVDAFKIDNCDKAYVLQGANIKKIGFNKHFVHIGLLDLYEDYISITE